MKTATQMISRTMESFLEIGIYDTSELEQLDCSDFRNVSLELDALSCLRYFPNAEQIILRPGMLNPNDLEFLYCSKVRALKLDYYTDEVDEYSIDLSRFLFLELVFARTQLSVKNVGQCPTLKTLIVQKWQTPNLKTLEGSSILALDIFGLGKLECLDGIEAMEFLVSLSLSNQRKLKQCEGLVVRKNLESLAINGCTHMTLQSIPPLPNLEYLDLEGKREVPDLSSLTRFPNLRYCILDFPIADGDTGILKSFYHAVLLTDRKNFSHKNNVLPKANQRFSSRVIPAWLEIIPGK